jgi:O-antigen/teichoic acid export membrane protein
MALRLRRVCVRAGRAGLNDVAPANETTDGAPLPLALELGQALDATGAASAPSSGAPSERAASAGEFRAPVIRGLLWQFLGRGTLQLSQMVVVVLLARLLTPREYGIAGMVLVITSFEPLVAGTGLAAALVQRPVITELDKSTVFWTNAAIGLLASVIGVAVSPLVADFYGNAEVAPLFAAVSVVFFVSSLSSVQANLLIREMNFRSLELRTMAATVIGAVVAIGLAAAGDGAWALIAQQLALYTVSLMLLTGFSRWRPRLMFSRESLRELRSFGGHTSGGILMNQLTYNTDNVLIGRVLGASALGLYTFGYSLIMLPVTRISSPVVAVLYPVFSRIQDDRRRLASLWLRSLRLMTAITLPAMLGLIVVTPEAIDVVFGRRWHAATPVVQILATVGIAITIQNLNGIVLQAQGRTRLVFRYSCVLFGGALIAFIVGLQWGIVGVAACFAAVNVFVQPPYLYLTARSLDIGLGQCGRALSGVIQATIVAIAAALITRGLLAADGAPATLRLVATIAAAAPLYGCTLAWRAPEVMSELRNLRPRRSTPATAGVAAA